MGGWGILTGHSACVPWGADGLCYWEDVAYTLSAFVAAFPPAAALLMQAQGTLLVQLAPLHSALLPELQLDLAAAPEQTAATAQVSIAGMINHVQVAAFQGLQHYLHMKHEA